MKTRVDGNMERQLTEELALMIADSGWVDASTIMVNCNPYYSSSLVQHLNHKLSPINGNELFETLPLYYPSWGESQVWNPETAIYQLFDRYLHDWVNKYGTNLQKYLFVSHSTSPHLQQIRNIARTKLNDIRFSTLFNLEEGFQADWKASTTEIPIIFEWENPLIKK